MDVEWKLNIFEWLLHVHHLEKGALFQYVEHKPPCFIENLMNRSIPYVILTTALQTDFGQNSVWLSFLPQYLSSSWYRSLFIWRGSFHVILLSHTFAQKRLYHMFLYIYRKDQEQVWFDPKRLNENSATCSVMLNRYECSPALMQNWILAPRLPNSF